MKQGEAEDEEDREGQACHVCGQCTGHSGPRCAAVKGTKSSAGCSIYTGPLYAFPCIDSKCVSFLPKHQEEVREVKKGGGQ